MIVGENDPTRLTTRGRTAAERELARLNDIMRLAKISELKPATR